MTKKEELLKRLNRDITRAYTAYEDHIASRNEAKDEKVRDYYQGKAEGDHFLTTKLSEIKACVEEL